MASFNVRVAGTWRSVNPWVKVAGTWRQVQSVWVRVGGTWRQVFVNITVSLANGNSSVATNSHVFSPAITITGGTPTAWSWSIVSTSGGIWSFNSTTASNPSLTVSGVGLGNTASAQIKCDVTIGGVVYTSNTASFIFTHIG